MTVILPTCDRPALLAQAIESVIGQTHTDWQLVVVDDGAGARAVVPDDPRIVLLHHHGRRGPAAARNRGLDVAEGEVVTFLDDDDVLDRDRLLRIVRRHSDTGAAPIAVCGSRFMDASSGSSRRVSGWVDGTILDGPTPSLGRTSVCRRLVPRFDERWRGVEDVEWWLRLAQSGPVGEIAEDDYVVRRHSGERGLNDLRTRVDENVRWLAEEPYFGERPRAAAYRLRRAGMLALGAEDAGLAIRLHLRSLRRRPSARTVRHLVRAVAAWLRHPRSSPTQPATQCADNATTTSGEAATK